MDSTRFDALTRRLGRPRSRRVLLGAGFAALTAQVGLAAPDVGPAARCSPTKSCPACHRCKHRRCKKHKNGAPCDGGVCVDGVCQASCTPNCQRKVCGGDGCGGSCGHCDAGQSCVDGACQASGCTPNCNHKVCGNDGCGGSCGTCNGGLVCVEGSCQDTCPAGQRLCRGNCIRNTLCCDDIDCASGQTCCPDGTCANLQTNPYNCGACGAGCPINETCSGGTCHCGESDSVAPSTCCDNTSFDICAPIDSGKFANALLCESFPACPSGYTVCVGSVPPKGIPDVDGCQVCCPPGTTCSLPEGVCLQQPPTDRAKRRAARRKAHRRAHAK